MALIRGYEVMSGIKDDIELSGLFKKIHEKGYDSKYCFLCGIGLNNQNRTDEHVIPKWLQKEFNLWDQTIDLLNKTTINYRKLKIPCCSECNNKYLSKMENTIRKGFEGGYQEFCKVDERIVFLWLSKIYYGILYKEMFLSINRTDPDQGTIVSEDFVRNIEMIYFFLQEIRGAHKCVGFKPASIFILKLQYDDNIKWNFSDRILTNFISIRMKDIGIIAVLGDVHTTKEVSAVEDFYKISLHPIQFNELCSIIFYRSVLLNRNPFYRSFQKRKEDYIETYLVPLQGLSTKPIFDEWEMRDYKEALFSFTGYPPEAHEDNDKVATWIHDENGNVREIPINENQFERYN
ncbi:MAG: hypothetical protein K9L73_03485 [Spirochaetia bacterium]|nr:hypothetical protein [Spirochaetia bacterium]